MGKKVFCLMKNELWGQIVKKFVGLRPQGYAYLKTKGTKRWVIKRNLKFKDFKNCLKANQIINKASYLENNGINVDSLKENHREFIENNKSLLRKQLKFKSQKHDVFTEEINKISLSSNDDNRILWIDAVETYPHGMSEDIIWKEEKITQLNIIKKYKKC